MLITNMHGNTYEIEGWKAKLSFPGFGVVNHMSMNRVYKSKTSAIFIETLKGKWYMVKKSKYYNLWIIHKLKFISYNPLYDIRKSHLHGNKYHASKA